MRSTRPSSSAPAGEDGPGARRRYYAITEEGRRQWAESRKQWEDTRALLDALIDIEEE